MDGVALADDGKFSLFFVVFILVALIEGFPTKNGNGFIR